MRGWIAAVAMGLQLVSGAINAQQAASPSPLLEHYRAYRTALERKDLETAEAEAAKALAASIEQCGDGGRTGVLAVNLAVVRLSRGEYGTAVEPARRALAIAETQGARSDVDVRVAKLLLWRAELPDGGSAAQHRLMQAITDAQGVPEIEAEAYPAATELAAAAYADRRYKLSRDAWAASAAFAEGSPVSVDYARAIAKTGEAAAFRQSELFAANPPVGTRITPVYEFGQIEAMLTEAMDLVHDQDMAGERGGELTLAQAAFGQAMAWKWAQLAKLSSEKRPLAVVAQPSKPGNEIGGSTDRVQPARYAWSPSHLRSSLKASVSKAASEPSHRNY